MAALPGPSRTDQITGEQAALRRVATLVARAAPPEDVFAAVTEEAGRMLRADHATMSRYEPDGTATVVASWSVPAAAAFPVGTRLTLGGRNAHTLVYQTGRAARIDDYAEASGRTGNAARELGFRASVSVPVSVEGGLWGLMIVDSRAEPLQAGTEARLAGFTELAATAIANAQARVELRGFAAEQAALRRVATLVARAATPEEVFAAVTEEAGRLLGAHHATMARYDPDGAATAVGVWGGTDVVFPVGSRWSVGGRNLTTMVLQTGQAARLDDFAEVSGPTVKARELGVRAGIGGPVSVEGRLWGIVILGFTRGPLPAGIETRLTGFTELAATAIANAQARVELRGFADEQAALRRVATLVARAAPPQEEVFAAVTEEAGRLLGAERAVMSRYGPGGAVVVASWSRTSAALAIGTLWAIGGENLHTMVFEDPGPARMDDYTTASGPAAEARDKGVRSGVAVPISAGGRLWGLMIVSSTQQEPLRADTEARLAGFTELAATAIANAAAQAALTASRARIVATADATRRRIERDLHDGAQQRLVSLALEVRAAQAAAAAGSGGVGQQLDRVATGMDGVLQDLREIAQGLHPVILAEGGLPPALKTLARRSAVPVHLDVQVGRRLPEPVETAAYYTVSEALTNTAKHARASAADVEVTESDGTLHVTVKDNGRGGADFRHGSGLVGLKDRAEALGGHLDLHSPPAAGTTLDVTLPVHDTGGPGLPSDPTARSR